jgi:hypothetical protein
MWGVVKVRGALAAILAAGFLALPAWASNSEPRPGTVNYVEGQASIADQVLNSSSVGSAELGAGQTLDTQTGKAEILLTPGVFLRLGNGSSAKMISPSLTNTQLELSKGEALIEVDELHPENDIRINEDGTTTRLLKKGLYEFDSTHAAVRVFSGKASVLEGDEKVTVKGGHELSLNASSELKAKSFNKNEFAKNDDLYRWSSLRSDYLAEANVDTARAYVVNEGNGHGWWGGGWYWSPWFGAYTFIPGNGYFYSPFGWGFYSPLWAYRIPVYGFRGYSHHFENFRPEALEHGSLRPAPVYGPGFHRGAVRSFGNVPRTGTFQGYEGVHSGVPRSGIHTGHMTGGIHSGFGGGVHR